MYQIPQKYRWETATSYEELCEAYRSHLQDGIMTGLNNGDRTPDARKTEIEALVVQGILPVAVTAYSSPVTNPGGVVDGKALSVQERWRSSVMFLMIDDNTRRCDRLYQQLKDNPELLVVATGPAISQSIANHGAERLNVHGTRSFYTKASLTGIPWTYFTAHEDDSGVMNSLEAAIQRYESWASFQVVSQSWDAEVDILYQILRAAQRPNIVASKSWWSRLWPCPIGTYAF